MNEVPQWLEAVLHTDSNNITVFFMQLSIISVLLSATSKEGDVQFTKFADEWSRIFSQRMPGRNTVYKDGCSESQPEKPKHVQACLDRAIDMRKIEHC